MIAGKGGGAGGGYQRLERRAARAGVAAQHRARFDEQSADLARPRDHMGGQPFDRLVACGACGADSGFGDAFTRIGGRRRDGESDGGTSDKGVMARAAAGNGHWIPQKIHGRPPSAAPRAARRFPL
ncbi:MAG: hypothetical protein V4537_08050 [Pseudomonadota bacterium]